VCARVDSSLVHTVSDELGYIPHQRSSTSWKPNKGDAVEMIALVLSWLSLAEDSGDDVEDNGDNKEKGSDEPHI